MLSEASVALRRCTGAMRHVTRNRHGMVHQNKTSLIKIERVKLVRLIRARPVVLRVVFELAETERFQQWRDVNAESAAEAFL